MTPARTIATILASLVFLTPCAVPDVHAGSDDPAAAIDASLREAKESATARLTLRIELEGQLQEGLRRLIIFGRGVGVWNGERQFWLTDEAVVRAIDRLLESGYSSMPERFTPREPDIRQNPVQLIRMVTVHVGGHTKIVIQDNKGAKSEEFKRLVDDLVALCAEPARSGLAAASLEDGLRKVADGQLAGETLWINANAPQLRSLDSQRGQGWMMTVRSGTLVFQTHDLEGGYQKLVERPLTEGEARRFARDLLEAKAFSLPPSINTSGHTQLTVAVLDQNVKTNARTIDAPDTEASVAAEQVFFEVRSTLLAEVKEAIRGKDDGPSPMRSPIVITPPPRN